MNSFWGFANNHPDVVVVACSAIGGTVLCSLYLVCETINSVANRIATAWSIRTRKGLR